MPSCACRWPGAKTRPAEGPRASIIVPVHNEELEIVKFLGGLAQGGVLGSYEVVVACNGCTDRTAELARSFEHVVVGETDTGGKPAGLNLGDRMATVFPRIYIDVDVKISKPALDAVVDVLNKGEVLAAAPSLTVNLAGRSWAVRSYYKIWSSLSWSTHEMIGSGVYAVSESGRARFAEFPEDPGLADDLFFAAHFAPSERKSIEWMEFEVPSSDSILAVVSRKTRILTLNAHTATYVEDLPGVPTRRGNSIATIVKSPSLWTALPVYVFVSMASHLAAMSRIRKQKFDWSGSQR